MPARAMVRLEEAMRSEGKRGYFEMLRPWLSASAATEPQACTAERLGISTEAVKSAVHRLRRRFREAVKAEIAQTVGDAANVKEELDCLMAALRG